MATILLRQPFPSRVPVNKRDLTTLYIKKVSLTNIIIKLLITFKNSCVNQLKIQDLLEHYYLINIDPKNSTVLAKVLDASSNICIILSLLFYTFPAYLNNTYTILKTPCGNTAISTVCIRPPWASIFLSLVIVKWNILMIT